MDSTAL